MVQTQNVGTLYGRFECWCSSLKFPQPPNGWTGSHIYSKVYYVPEVTPQIQHMLDCFEEERRQTQLDPDFINKLLDDVFSKRPASSSGFKDLVETVRREQSWG